MLESEYICRAMIYVVYVSFTQLHNSKELLILISALNFSRLQASFNFMYISHALVLQNTKQYLNLETENKRGVCIHNLEVLVEEQETLSLCASDKGSMFLREHMGVNLWYHDQGRKGER